jgi:fido (protein-threonine AMPylation protein)
MDEALSRDDVVVNLWNSYTKTPDYKCGLTEGIPPNNKLVEKQERLGLERVYDHLVKKSAIHNLKDRAINDWLKEWKEMHNLLFAFVLKKRGDWRKKDLRIGDPYDNLLALPPWQDVPRRISEFAHRLNELLSFEYKTNKEKYLVLAEIHYKFVMIHPFDDGNGRIARALTDQISLYLGLTTAMVGYPKHNKKKQSLYHRAINRSAKFKNVVPMSQWIESYIEKQLSQLA